MIIEMNNSKKPIIVKEGYIKLTTIKLMLQNYQRKGWERVNIDKLYQDCIEEERAEPIDIFMCDIRITKAKNKSYHIAMAELYERYLSWHSKHNDQEQHSQRQLNQLLVNKGYAKYKSNGKWCISWTPAEVYGVAEHKG